MAFRSISGSKIVGQGKPQPTPITLDADVYEGAIAYGDDGNLYFSNGTSWLVLEDSGGAVQGTTGIQGTDGLQGGYGPGFTVVGSVADVDTGGDPQATLNAAFSSPSTGDAVIDEADDELWVYNGSSWVNVGSFRGVQGFQGTDGLQGLQGTIGNEEVVLNDAATETTLLKLLAAVQKGGTGGGGAGGSAEASVEQLAEHHREVVGERQQPAGRVGAEGGGGGETDHRR